MVGLVMNANLARPVVEFFSQVYSVADSPARVQVRRSCRFANSHHVSVLTRAEARHTFRAVVIISQVHAQRSPDWFDAPRSHVDTSC
jgi:hypothetical protein